MLYHHGLSVKDSSLMLSIINRFSPGNVWTPMWDWLAEKQGSGRDDMITGGIDAQVNRY